MAKGQLLQAVYNAAFNTTVGITFSGVNEGDLLVFLPVHRNNATVTSPPAGATYVDAYILGYPNMYAYYKIAGPSEPTTFNVTVSGSNDDVGMFGFRFEGPLTAGEFSVSNVANANSVTSLNIPASPVSSGGGNGVAVAAFVSFSPSSLDHGVDNSFVLSTTYLSPNPNYLVSNRGGRGYGIKTITHPDTDIQALLTVGTSTGLRGVMIYVEPNTVTAKTASDSQAVLVAETAAIQVSVAVNDSMAVLIAEDPVANVLFEYSDDANVKITETASIDTGGDVVVPANDSQAVLITETASIVVVDDIKSATDTLAALLSESAAIVMLGNQDPVEISPIGNKAYVVGQVIGVSIATNFSDPDADSLSFALAPGSGPLPPNLSLSSAGVISGTLDASDLAGAPYNNIIVRVTDDGTPSLYIDATPFSISIGQIVQGNRSVSNERPPCTRAQATTRPISVRAS